MFFQWKSDKCNWEKTENILLILFQMISLPWLHCIVSVLWIIIMLIALQLVI